MELLSNEKYVLDSPRQVKFVKEKLSWTRDDLVVKVKAVGVCTADCQNYLYNNTKYFGHELLGEIITPFQNFNQGELVLVSHKCHCQECDYCKAQKYNLCSNPININVGFSRYIKIPKELSQYCIYKVPTSLSPVEVVFTDSIACVVHLLGIINLTVHDRVLILGNGFIAMIIGFLLKFSNISFEIFGRNTKKHVYANKLGLHSNLSDRTNNNSVVDVCIDTTGDGTSINMALNRIKSGGRLVCFSKFGGSLPYLTLILAKEIQILSSKFYNPSDVNQAFNLLQKGAIPMNDLIGYHAPVSQLENVIQKTLSSDIIRGVVYFEE